MATTCKKKSRSYGYDRLTGILHIRNGSNETGYYLDAAGEEIELTKILKRGTVYTVRLSGGKASCTCPGYCSHRHCKHADCLAHMRASNRV